MTDENEQESPLLTGDHYDGAYGPTIILIARSPTACAWLQGVFRELATTGSARTLTAEPGVTIKNVDAIELACRPAGPRVTLRQEGDTGKSFVWSATPEGWLYLVDLVQPLADGGTGHQYLTDDGDDAALIELSSGEQDVLKAARATSGNAGTDNG